MPFSRRIHRTVFASLAMSLAASLTLPPEPAFADGGKGRGEEREWRGDRPSARNEARWREEREHRGGKEREKAERWGRDVPPGLDKKPGNMPPGQYKKVYGERIEDLSRYRLPQPPRGERYVISDGRIYRVMSDTAIVVAALGVVSDWLR